MIAQSKARMGLPPPRDPVRTPLVALLAVCSAGGLRLSCTVIRAASEIESWCAAVCFLCPMSSVSQVHHTCISRQLRTVTGPETTATTRGARLMATKTSPGHETSSIKHLGESTICGEQNKPLSSAMSRRPCRRPLCARQVPAQEQTDLPHGQSSFEQQPKMLQVLGV